MANNHEQPGRIIKATNASGVDWASGDLVAVGDLAAVCLVDIPNGESGSVAIDEVFRVPKLSTDDMAQGVTVYLDASNKHVTLSTDDGGDPAVDFIAAGKVTEAAAAATTTALLKLNA